MTRRRRSIPDTRSACVSVRACVCVRACVRVHACKGVELACASAHVGRCVRVWHCPCADVTLRGAAAARCVRVAHVRMPAERGMHQRRPAATNEDSVAPLRPSASTHALCSHAARWRPHLCTLHMARSRAPITPHAVGLHGVRLHGVRLHGVCCTVHASRSSRTPEGVLHLHVGSELHQLGDDRRMAALRHGNHASATRSCSGQRRRPVPTECTGPEGSQPTPDRRPNPAA